MAGRRKTRAAPRRSIGHLPGLASDAQRRLIADYCQLLSQPLTGKANTPFVSSPRQTIALSAALPPRLRQTLDRLLAGDSEKQIAVQLHISPHTVHSYVKTLHKRFKVASRGELLARFVSHAT